MEIQKYQNKYTEDGLSIKRLKKLAKVISKERGVKLTDSKHLVAQDYGYASWNVIAQQTPNPDRDNFFRHVYSSSFSDNLYLNYLRDYGLKDSLDTKRGWALMHWSYLESANHKPSSFRFNRLSGGMLEQAVEASMSKNGIEGVLPQNLSNDVLGSLLETWVEFQQRPSDAIEPYINIVGAIYKHLHRDFDETSDRVDLTTECNVYAFNLRCERIGRYSNTKFSKPSLETVLDKNTSITMRQPEKVLDVIRCDVQRSLYRR